MNAYELLAASCQCLSRVGARYVLDWAMINWQRVDELREEIGAEDFLEVVELFLEEVQEVIDRLRESPDPARFEEDMHFLKGSAVNLGFQNFADLCAAGEKNAAAGQTALVDATVVIGSYDASRRQFLAELDARVAA